MAILTKAQLQAANSSSFPNNNSQQITPQILRDYNSSVIDTLVDSLDTGSFARTDLSNTFSATNNFTSISASSFISASAFIGDGSKLTNITASVALPILDEGVLQGYATSMNFTGSAISAVVTAGTAVVQVNIDNVGLVTTASFNAYTSSTNTSITNLNASSASQQISINALNQSSASQQVSINALNVYTASQSSASIVTSITELNSWSASAKIELVNLNTSVTNLNSFSSSTNSSITQLNASSASQQVSINALNVSSASLNTFSASAQISINSINAASSSWITESETGSFVTTNTTQTITGIKSFNTAFQMVGTNYIQFGNFSTNTIAGGSGKNINIGATSGDGDNSINITTGVEGSSSPFGPDKITLRTPSNNTGNSITLQSANIVMSGSVDISGNLTASLSNGYVWVGNSNNRTSLVATSSFTTNVSGFVTTASFNSYTSSNNQRVSSLEAATSSYVTESETGSFARYDVSNPWSANQTFTNITATSASIRYLTTLYETSSVIYSSGSNQLGDELTDIQTLSGSVKVQGTLTINGLPVATGSTDISALNQATASLQTFTASAQISINALNTNSASVNTSITNLNASSASQQVSIDALNTFTASQSTASLVTSITNLNTFSASALVSITNINSATASLFTSASLALVTASFDNGTRNLTFTKGNTTQFSVNIPDASGSASTNTGSLLVTASAFINTITFTKGDGTTFPVTVTTGSLNYVTGSFGAFYDTTTQSGSAGVAYSMKLNNTDISDGVIISGSGGIKVLAAGTYDLQFSAQVLADTGSDTLWIWLKKNGTNVPDTTTKLVLANNEANVAAWNFVVSANANDVFELAWQSNGGHTKLFAEAAASNYPAIPSVIATMNRVDVGGGTNLVSTSSFNSYTSSNDQKVNSLIAATGSYATTASFNSYTSSTNIRLNNLESTTASLNTSVTNLNQFTASQSTGSLVTSITNLNTFSASALISISNLNQSSASQQVSIDSINAKTGSFATTGSNSFIGNQTITGSLILSSSNAVELQVIGNSVFTGSANGNVVALSITSNTASMDLNLGNYFTLTLANTATTHISASNVQPGVSATLVITTGTNSSASLAPTMLQPSGSAYSATNGSAKKDVLSIVAVASGVPFVVSTKNMI